MPDTFIVRVPLFTFDAAVAVAAFPPIDKPEAVPVRPVPAPEKEAAVNAPAPLRVAILVVPAYHWN